MIPGVLPDGGAEGARAAESRFFGFACADVAANLPVEEAERVGHGVADVGQTQQHQRNAQNGVKDGHHFAPLRLRSNVPVTYRFHSNEN